MLKDELKGKLALQFALEPQKAYQANSAIAGVFAGLEELAKLGHTYQLVEGASALPLEFPKMVYSDSLAPYELVVNSQDELEALPQGWDVHPSLRIKAQEPEAGEVANG